MSRLIIFAFGLLVLNGCSQMQDAAEKSARNSRRAADNSDSLIKLSSAAYADGRQGAGRDRRMQEIQRLESATDLNSKIVSASAYLAAFEFQLWKESEVPGDNEARREGMFAEAVMEFLRQMKAYQTSGEVSVGLNPAVPKTEAQKNLLAFGLSLHRISERQREASIAGRFKSVSMFDLLAMGLSSDGKNAGRHTVEVQKELEVAAMLIQVRQLGLFAAAVAKVRNPSEMQGVLAGRPDTVWTIRTEGLQSVTQLDAVLEMFKGSIQSAKILGKYAGLLPAVDPAAKTLMATIRGGSSTSDLAVPRSIDNDFESKRRELDEVVALLPDQAAVLNQNQRQ